MHPRGRGKSKSHILGGIARIHRSFLQRIAISRTSENLATHANIRVRFACSCAASRTRYVTLCGLCIGVRLCTARRLQAGKHSYNVCLYWHKSFAHFPYSSRTGWNYRAYLELQRYRRSYIGATDTDMCMRRPQNTSFNLYGLVYRIFILIKLLIRT